MLDNFDPIEKPPDEVPLVLLEGVATSQGKPIFSINLLCYNEENIFNSFVDEQVLEFHLALDLIYPHNTSKLNEGPFG